MLKMYSTIEGNIPETVLKARKQIKRIDPTSLDYPEFPQEFISNWLNMLTKSKYVSELKSYFVEFAEPSSKLQSIGSLCRFLQNICKCRKNECAIIRGLEGMTGALHRFMKEVDDDNRFKDFMRHLSKHQPKDCDCNMSFIAEFLVQNGVNIDDTLLKNIRWQQDASLMWIAKMMTNPTAAFEAAVTLDMDPDYVQKFLSQYQSNQILVANIKILQYWRDSRQTDWEHKIRLMSRVVNKFASEAADKLAKTQGNLILSISV